MLVEDNEYSSLLNEVELLLNSLAFCTDEARFSTVEKMVKDILELLLKAELAKAFWLKSKLSNLGKLEELSDADFEKEWLALIIKASNGGCAEAEYEYGCYLIEQENYQDSINLLKKSADKGVPSSQWCYGLQLVNGLHVNRDIAQGLFYIHLAAEMRYEYAVEYLIEKYSSGCDDLKIEKDDIETNKWKTVLSWIQ